MFYGTKAQYKTEKRIRLSLLFSCKLRNFRTIRFHRIWRMQFSMVGTIRFSIPTYTVNMRGGNAKGGLY